MKTIKEELSQKELSSKVILQIYNRGYLAGHNDTVEGHYKHISHQDMATHHEDIIDDIIDGIIEADYRLIIT
jgi:predicted nucleic acid-binding OB-fold protein